MPALAYTQDKFLHWWIFNSCDIFSEVMGDIIYVMSIVSRLQLGMMMWESDVARLTRLIMDGKVRSHLRQTMCVSRRNQKCPAGSLTIINSDGFAHLQDFCVACFSA